MNDSNQIKMPIGEAMSHLYGYIFSMLLSNALVGIPFFGGALYLVGRSAILCFDLLSRRSRKYLSAFGRHCTVSAAIVLFVVAAVLFGFYPTTFDSSRLWALYAAVALELLADTLSQRFGRMALRNTGNRTRIIAISFLLQMLIVLAAGVILVNHLKDGWQFLGGFALPLLFRLKPASRIDTNRSASVPSDKTDLPIHSVQAYRSFQWINMTLFALVELVVGVIYALLATRTEWLLPSILIGVAVTFVFMEAAIVFLRRTKKPKRRDPTRMILAGLALIIAGAAFCVWMLRAGQVDYLRVYFCLGIVSAGSALVMAGLFKITHVMTNVMSFIGSGSTEDYLKTRHADLGLARLVGDTLALLILTIICFINGDSLPKDLSQLAARFQPVMTLPVILVAVGAFFSVYHFPLSDKYIEKLQSFLLLRQTGEENEVMRSKLENVVSGVYGQPFLTRFLASLVRPFFRYRLEHEERIQSDVRNPILFLGNHLEVLGPILCTLWFPVPVRFWSISTMMDDRKKVTEYVYSNTFSKVTWLPRFLQKLTAMFIGWLSVNVMNQLECIPVYRDSPMKLRETIRCSIEALESGDNLMIFPESSHEKYALQGIGKLSPGFVMLAAAYWRKCGKKLRMMPVYACKEKKIINFGTIFEFNPDNAYADEQDRIIRETERQILEMAGIDPAADGEESE